MIPELLGARCTGLFCRWKITFHGLPPAHNEQWAHTKCRSRVWPLSAPTESTVQERSEGKRRPYMQRAQVRCGLFFSSPSQTDVLFLQGADPDQRPICTSVPGLGGRRHGEAWNPLSTPSNSTQRVQLSQIWVVKTESESHGITCCRQTRRPGREFTPASAR